MKKKKISAMILSRFASPEAIDHIMVQKFVRASPLYRQEQDPNSSNLSFSRQTMTIWILRATDDRWAPICDEMHRRLMQAEVLYADKTTLQILKKNKKGANFRSSHKSRIFQ